MSTTSLDSFARRIISASIMLVILIICSIIGFWGLTFLTIIVGLALLDETLILFGKNRFGKEYTIYQLIYLAAVLVYCLIPSNPLLDFLFLLGSLFSVAFLLFYLFLTENSFANLFARYSFIVPVYLFVTLATLISLLKSPQAIGYFWLLITIVCSMDIGAWFWGTRFGKRKLWESVSPSKTIEGAIGGVISSAILGLIVYAIFFGTPSIALFVLFALMAAFSHLGDLVESKLKRNFNVKDSSHLIPGHGGVYDRVDGLIFLIPIFVLWAGTLSLAG